MTLVLPPDLEVRLKSEASRRGLDANDYAVTLIARALPESAAEQETLDLLARWESENDANDHQEIARREREFEESKQAMNRNRLEGDGPYARKVFP